MAGLELKIAPDLVWTTAGALMWVASRVTPRLGAPAGPRVGLATLVVTAGVGLIVAARVALARADTTWQPANPAQTTQLVTTGIYRFSRNPIYLGMLLVLVGWGVVLASPLALVISALFVPYEDAFQIRPEERILTVSMGQEYVDYAARVRRWV